MQDPHDPSMEEALAAIKRVMAEEKELRVSARLGNRPGPAAEEPEPASESETVLELDEPVAEEMSAPDADLGPPLVSSEALEASRARLAELQQAAANAPAPPAVHPMEAMVREMLRPMLADWLDQNLPAIVEEQVKREIGRITGQRL